MKNPAAIESEYQIVSNLAGFLDFEAFKLFNVLAETLQKPDIPVLEIGVFCGRSLAGLACAFDRSPIVGVDPFFKDFYHSPAYQDEAGFLTWASQNLSPAQRETAFWIVINSLESTRKAEFKSRINLKHVTQETFLATELGRSKFQVCHVDGEHTFAAIHDLFQVLDDLLVPNSWVIVDDLFNGGFPEISEAVHTDAGHRTTFWPILFGFNKGVYLFKPDSPETLDKIKTELRTAYASPSYIVRLMRDNAIGVSVIAPVKKTAQTDSRSRLRRIRDGILALRGR